MIERRPAALAKRSDARRGLTAAVVSAEQLAIADHRLTQDRGPPEAVGELATELREQAVRVGHGRPDGRRIGAVREVELRHNQLMGEDQTRVGAAPPDRRPQHRQQLAFRVRLAAEYERPDRPP